MNNIPEAWLKYGIPDAETAKLRNKLHEIIWQALEDRGFKREPEEWRRLSVTAGAWIFFITVTDPLIAKQGDELKQIIQDTVPTGYSYEWNDDSDAGS